MGKKRKASARCRGYGRNIGCFMKRLVPVERIELPTFGLQNRCTTAVLHRLNLQAEVAARAAGRKFHTNVNIKCSSTPKPTSGSAIVRQRATKELVSWRPQGLLFRLDPRRCKAASNFSPCCRSSPVPVWLDQPRLPRPAKVPRPSP